MPSASHWTCTSLFHCMTKASLKQFHDEWLWYVLLCPTSKSIFLISSFFDLDFCYCIFQPIGINSSNLLLHLLSFLLSMRSDYHHFWHLIISVINSGHGYFGYFFIHFPCPYWLFSSLYLAYFFPLIFTFFLNFIWQFHFEPWHRS